MKHYHQYIPYPSSPHLSHLFTDSNNICNISGNTRLAFWIKTLTWILLWHSFTYTYHRELKMSNRYFNPKTYYKADELRHMARDFPTHGLSRSSYNNHGRSSKHWGGMCVVRRNSAAAAAAAEPALVWKNCLGCGKGWARAVLAEQRDSVAAQLPKEKENKRRKCEVPVDFRLLSNLLNKSRINEKQS